ncbi:MAG: 50S ribosomal protein L18e [Candidatus Altarchaeaceae archaeon]
MARTYNNPNPERIKVIETLKEFNKEKRYKIWDDIIERLSKRRKNRAEVNLWKINKYTKDNDVVIVPGKVLGKGKIDHKVTVCALEFSESVKRFAENNENLNLITFYDLLKQNPRGSNVKILE